MGNWDAGMVAGLKATCQRLDGSMENDSLAEPGDGGSFDFPRSFLLLRYRRGTLPFAARKQSRCPNCGNTNYKEAEAGLFPESTE